MKKFIFGIILLILSLTFCTNETKVSVPIAKKDRNTKTLFNVQLVDDYSYFKNRDDSYVLNYIKSENDYTEASMKHTNKIQKKLYDEMIGRIEENDASVPESIDSFFYYSKNIKGKDYPVYVRKLKTLDAKEETLIDMNELAKKYPFYDIRNFSLSDDHKFLAYSFDTAGNEKYTLRIMDIKEKRLLADIIENVSSIAWTSDGKGFYYTAENDISRSDALYYHFIGNDKDTLLYLEKDEKYSVYLSKTRSREFILLSNTSNITSEISYTRADDPEFKFKYFKKRTEGVEYYVEHAGKYFFILTNENALNFKIMRVHVDSVDKDWSLFIKERTDSMIESFDGFTDYLSIYERDNGKKMLRILSLKDSSSRYFDFKEDNCSFYAYGNSNFDCKVLRVEYMSLKTPATTIDIDMSTFSKEVKKVQDVKGGFKSDDYVTEYVYAKADDGSIIPISLVYKKGLKMDSNNPLYLTGYGAYGSSEDVYFSSIRISLLERGFIYAIAHIRGGSDKGRGWYNDGKLLNKKHTFEDFVRVSEYLIDNKYTSKEHLVISGGSAGGLLIGAVVNMRPDLFKIAVADVPFVDIINTMLDSTLPLTVGEYDEWGNPNDSVYFNYMLSYSPYDNVKKQNYPAMLITGGFNDIRVSYWEPVKWCAKLRAYKTDSNPLLLKIQMNAGHGGGSGRYEYYKEIAFEYAFILDVLKIK